MHLVFRLLILFLSGLVVSCATQQAGERRNDHDHAKYALDAIYVTILNGASPKGRYACSNPIGMTKFACIGPVKAELGLLVLEVGKSQSYYDALTRLVGLKIDAGLSEDFSCSLYRNKEHMKITLSKASAKDIHDGCTRDINLLIYKLRNNYSDLSAKDVCWDINMTERRLRSYIKLVKSGPEIFAESGPC